MAKEETKAELKETRETPIAYELAKRQKEISVAEFFTKNRHLLGFDNKRKALLMTVKEAVDNSLDACQEANVLPEINVEIIEMSEFRYKVIIEDNGPGIVKKQIPNIFAKLLYGSKFHTLRQSLTADEPILIKHKGRICLAKIGEFIDKFIDEEGEFTCSELEVPSFDWDNYNYKFRSANRLIKHKRENEIYKISTLYGKNIKVTGCHSVFTINKETLKVEEVQVRDLSLGDIIIAPKRLNTEESKNEINILDYIEESDSKKQFWYLYIDKKIISEIFSKAIIVHNKKHSDKSRKYYRFLANGRVCDVLDDSYKQYARKGFLPVWLAKFLDLRINNGILRTHQHGKEYNIPVIWPMTSDLMKVLGLFVAEGHTDNRQLGFTFSNKERDLVKLVCNAGFALGANYTVEERPAKNCVRVKLFGGILSYLFRKWCGKGAKNKKVPDFVFAASHDLRQDFIDYLHVGDGHSVKGRNCLTLGTVSEQLASETVYLWLMQGVIATYRSKFFRGLGKTQSKCHLVSVYGNDVNTSNHFSSHAKTKRRIHDLNLRLLSRLLGKSITKEAIIYLQKLNNLRPNKKYSKNDFSHFFNQEKIGYKLRFMLDNGFVQSQQNSYCISQKTEHLSSHIRKLELLLESDLAFLPIKNIEVINEGYEFVYDISVPGYENFVGGFGALACHNSRGQQGIGISAAVLYSQLTTGKPAKITSRVSRKEPAHYYELGIDTQNNKPVIAKESEVEWPKEHGTKVEIDLEGEYLKGNQSVDEYLKQTAVINPHVTIIYTNPKSEQVIYARATDKLPSEPKEIKPHPYGIELGMLMDKLRWTESRTLQSFLTSEFSRVGPGTAKEICEHAAVLPNTKPSQVSRDMAEKLLQGIQKTKIIAPPTDCLSPIGEELLEKGLRKEIKAEFYCATSRPPAVYRGNPFIIETACAFGGEIPKEEKANILRYANRVPLLYQEGACAMTNAIVETNWKPYGLQQSGNSIPVGPVVIVVHMASVWVPFTSESKEAIAHYQEIIKEIKLALQECGRLLGTYVRKKTRISEQIERANMFEKYIPEIADSLSVLSGEKKDKILQGLQKMLVKPEIKREILQEDEDDKLYRMEFNKAENEENPENEK